MNDVEFDFLKRISDSMDIMDIIEVLGVNEADLVNAFSEVILEEKYEQFKEFMDGPISSEEADEEV